jgi:hypothetical protein
MIEQATRPTDQSTAAFVFEEWRSLERRIAAVASYRPVSAARMIVLGAALLAVACATTMCGPYKAPTQERGPTVSTPGASTAGAGATQSLTGRWRVVRLDVRGGRPGEPDFALAVSSKYPPTDGRLMSVGMNGMVYIRERSMSYSDAWITQEGRLDLWWGAGPDQGVLPTLMGWAGKGELNEAEGVFRFTDWARQIVFRRNADGTVTFHIPWTRTTATIEHAEEPMPRNDLRVSAQVLRFDDAKPPPPEPVARPRATLLWERPGGAAVSTNDHALSFRTGQPFESATFAIDLAGPPPESWVSRLGSTRFALAHVVVYDDVDQTNHLEHTLVSRQDGRDVVRGISNVAILWQAPGPRDSAATSDPFLDTWSGYQLVTIGPDGRSAMGHTPWAPAPYRRFLPETAGALATDPEHPLPFTVILQEKAVVHDLPRLLR